MGTLRKTRFLTDQYPSAFRMLRKAFTWMGSIPPIPENSELKLRLRMGARKQSQRLIPIQLTNQRERKRCNHEISFDPARIWRQAQWVKTSWQEYLDPARGLAGTGT